MGLYITIDSGYLSPNGGGPSKLKIATDDTLSINCDKDCSEVLCYYTFPCWQGRRPNFFIAGNGELGVDAGGTIDLKNGQMLMAGGEGW